MNRALKRASERVGKGGLRCFCCGRGMCADDRRRIVRQARRDDKRSDLLERVREVEDARTAPTPEIA